jgi:hypothetical protein
MYGRVSLPVMPASASTRCVQACELGRGPASERGTHDGAVRGLAKALGDVLHVDLGPRNERGRRRVKRVRVVVRPGLCHGHVRDVRRAPICGEDEHGVRRGNRGHRGVCGHGELHTDPSAQHRRRRRRDARVTWECKWASGHWRKRRLPERRRREELDRKNAKRARGACDPDQPPAEGAL